jgi:hypothetical protein
MGRKENKPKWAWPKKSAWLRPKPISVQIFLERAPSPTFSSPAHRTLPHCASPSKGAVVFLSFVPKSAPTFRFPLAPQHQGGRYGSSTSSSPLFLPVSSCLLVILVWVRWPSIFRACARVPPWRAWLIRIVAAMLVRRCVSRDVCVLFSRRELVISCFKPRRGPARRRESDRRRTAG